MPVIATPIKKPFVFVLMPFEEKFNDIYKFGIKGSAEEVGAYAERVDEQIFTEGILDRIFNQINKADVIVADMTDRNPNVFYEVGYAHAIEKIVLLVTQKSEDIPFDLKHRQHIVYEGKIEKLRKELTKKLKWAINESKRQSIKNVEAEYLSFTPLEVSDFKYIYDSFNKDIEITFVLLERMIKASESERETKLIEKSIYNFSYIDSIIYYISKGNTTLTINNFLYEISEFLSGMGIPEQPENKTNKERYFSDASINTNILVEFRKFGIIRNIDPSKLIDQDEFTEKMYRFHYWLDYNKLISNSVRFKYIGSK